MIKFPNSFKGNNITVKTHLEKETDLSYLYEDRINLNKELLIRLMKKIQSSIQKL